MNISRKIISGLFLILLSLLGVDTANAIPAIPHPIDVIQPDGSHLTIRMRGDESGFTVLTVDDLPILKNRDGFYEYIDPADISRCSGIRVSDVNLRTPSEKNWISTSGILTAPVITIGNRPLQQLKRSSTPSKIKISNYPTIGRQKALVVLVEFSDRKFTTMENVWGYYNGMLNEPGFTYKNGANGSARDFYLDSSGGLFDPEFVVIGPIQLNNPLAYYGGDTDNTLDPNACQMVVDACRLIDAEIDFSEFDADNDGYVDSIYFFYAGFGEADSNKSESIWPHNGLLKDNWKIDLQLDGVIINNYACSNEIRYSSSYPLLPVGIGTFVHEFGHVLGLADHYDTSYTSGRIGVEQWDTMAAASYNNNQNTPPAFSAFERSELGWMSLTDIKPLQQGILRVPVLTSSNPHALVVRVPGEENEYFIIERREKSGWDSFLPAAGILVWHIDMMEERWKDNSVNNDPLHQCVDIMEADSSENANTLHGDVFPGSGNVTTYDFTSWNGDKLFSFDHVEEMPDESLILFGDTGFIPSTPGIKISDVHGTSFKVEWEVGDDAIQYLLSLYDTTGDKLKEIPLRPEGTNMKVELAGLQPLSEYKVEVMANAGSYHSMVAYESVSTGILEFFESVPGNLAISSIGEGCFALSWDSLEGATDYEATLFRMEYGAPTALTYGFDEGIDGLPEGWSTNSSNTSKALFGEKSPALQLLNDEDWLEICYPGKEITNVIFYFFSQIDSNILKVEGFNSLQEIIYSESIRNTESGSPESIELPESVERIRITFERTGGYMVIDDVTVGLRSLEGIPYEPYVAVSTGGGNILVIESLDQTTEYECMVEGVHFNEKSQPSERLRFSPSTMPSGIAHFKKSYKDSEEWFDLTGRKVNEADVTQGVYIVRKEGKTKKVILKSPYLIHI